jgi:RNA polymerase sigma factor (sigma-70 family)
MSELLQGVRRLVDQTRQTLAKRPLHHLPEPTLERREGSRQRKQNAPNAIEEWYVKEEALQRLDEIIQRDGLSPREAEFLSLHYRGLSYSAIATQAGVVVGTVKRTMFRMYKKLRKTANS